MDRIYLPSSWLPNALRVQSPKGANPILFRLGETLEGSVIEVIDDHHAVIQWKGNDLAVESQIPLSKGMEGYFRVEAIHPQVILKFIPKEGVGEPGIESLLKKYFPFDVFPEDLFQNLSKLWEMKTGGLPLQMQDAADRLSVLLQNFSLRNHFSLDPEHLREIITQGGLFFEAKLRGLIETGMEDQYDQRARGDLKGLLLELKARLTSLTALGSNPDEVPIGLKDMLSSLDLILQKIEGYQILNLDPSTPPGKFFLLLPLWFQGNLQLVEMTLSLPHPTRDGSSSEEHSILFLLHLPGWGRLSIEVKMRGKELYCRFTVSNPEISTFLNEGFPHLKAKLNQVGFQPHLALSIESPDKIVQTWLSEIIERRDSLLNVVV